MFRKSQIINHKSQIIHLIIGGAILDDDGNMRGSVMMVQFETEDDFKNWYANEPYITGGVWKVIEVRKFRVAEV